jgi:hypothetical protein
LNMFARVGKREAEVANPVDVHGRAIPQRAAPEIAEIHACAEIMELRKPTRGRPRLG